MIRNMNSSYVNENEEILFKFLRLLKSDRGGAKGCKLCCLCEGWIGPPFDFHKKSCSAGSLLKRLWKLAYPEYEKAHKLAKKKWPWVR